MLAPILLLVGVEASASADSLSITIDPCVQVDAGEVRRLTALELGALADGLGSLEVAVSCEAGHEELTLSDRDRGRVGVRNIDLGGDPGDHRDARARELALAIAELVRRAANEPPPARAVPTTPDTDRRAPEPSPPPSDEPAPFLVEVGGLGVAVRWTGGETLFGADLAGRLRLGRWFLAELRLGARKSRATELSMGTIDGRGGSGSVGFALSALESVGAGVSFGARLGGDWLHYVVLDRQGARYGSGDVRAASLLGTVTGFGRLAGPLCVTVDVAVGGALHPVVFRDEGRLVSGLSGVVLSTAAGMAARF